METGIWPLYEIEDRKFKMYGNSQHLAVVPMSLSISSSASRSCIDLDQIPFV